MQVAELGSPPASNSCGVELVEKPVLTETEYLQQNSNEAQGIQVQESETTIMGHSTTINGKKSLQFLIQVGKQASDHWKEGEAFMQHYCNTSSKIFSDSRIHFFGSHRYSINTIFDITLISNLDSISVIHQFGLEIVNIVDIWNHQKVFQAAKITQQAIYEIEIPDILSEYEVRSRYGDSLEINRDLSAYTSEKFVLDSEKRIFNYEVLLKNYIQNMPNNASVRFWVKTQDSKYFSDLIYIGFH